MNKIGGLPGPTNPGVDNSAAIIELVDLTTAAPVSNIYTLNTSGSKNKSFKITSADANAKTITLSNVSTTNSLTQITVLLICTTAAAFTHPTGATFAAGAPTFTTGQSYWITYDSVDGGTTWAGYSTRRS